jgi:hypothetical protein
MKSVDRSTFSGLLEEERKIDPHIFYSDLKTSFKILFFEALLDMLKLG